MSALPIEDHLAIGDGRSVALLDGRGNVAWLCWPRFDSDAVLSGLLDDGRGGTFRIAPATDGWSASARYVDDTNVVVTRFTASDGVFDLVDLMPVDADGNHDLTLAPEHELLRVVVGRQGTPTIRIELDPRPGFGARAAKMHCHDEAVHFEDAATLFSLHVDGATVRFLPRPDGGVEAMLRVNAGQRVALPFTLASDMPAARSVYRDGGAEAVETTVAWWRAWAARARFEGPYRPWVVRSALALKLLCYAPSGAIIAAPTTSLPEKRGSWHNWDYRFCWLRDAAFTSRALFGLGYDAEALAFVDWLTHATRLTHPRLQVLYDVFGEPAGDERVLEHLRGWDGALPVRTGNGAADQLQLDLYGEVIDAVASAVRARHTLDPGTMKVVGDFASYIAAHWREPDEGIWEPRSGKQPHVHSRVLAWVAVDRTLELASSGHVRLSTRTRASLERAKLAIASEVERRGWSDKRRSYVSTLDGDSLDAALLLLSWYGFEDASSPRMRATAEAIDRELGVGNGLVLRNRETPDGGGFAACAFWAVEHLARGGGTLGEARARFEQLLACSSPHGLYGEIIEGGPRHAALGNFPQGFSHLALISAAIAIEERVRRERKAA